MSQQRKTELLVTARNCQEFGEDESPSKMAEKRNREKTSCPFPLSFSSFFVPGSSKEHNTGIFLHGKKPNELSAVLMCCNAQSSALAPDVLRELNLTLG